MAAIHPICPLIVIPYKAGLGSFINHVGQVITAVVMQYKLYRKRFMVICKKFPHILLSLCIDHIYSNLCVAINVTSTLAKLLI